MTHRTEEIPQDRWHGYFAWLTESVTGREATIEVIGPDETGDQVPVERVPLHSITYDQRDDIVSIEAGRQPATSDVRHIVERPRKVWADRAEAPMPDVVGIEDEAGRRTLVQLSVQPEIPSST